MFSNTSAEVLLNTPSRCITSVYDKKIHRFIVGTAALSSNNHMAQQEEEETTLTTIPCFNPLYILRYQEDMNELIIDSQVDFGENGGSGEVWSISSCPFDSKLIMVCRNGLDQKPDTGLWRIPQDAMKEEEDLDYYRNDYADRNRLEDENKIEDMNQSMEQLARLHIHSTMSDCGIFTNRVTDMHWNPQCYKDPEDIMLGDMNLLESTNCSSSSDAPFNFMTVHQGSLREVTVSTWNISDGIPTLTNPVEEFHIPTLSERGSLPNPPKASWDPHNTHMCAVTLGTNIAIVDFRTPSKVVHGLKSCHRLGVMDVDYNSVKPMVLCSSGQDSLIKFWDLRFTSSYTNEQPTQSDDENTAWSIHQPLKIIRGGHTHWANVVKYNTFHDQLILSGGTDGICNLWRMSSISSAPLTDLATTDGVHNFELDENDHLGSNSSFDKDDYRNSHEDDDNDESSTDTTSQGEESNPDIRVSQMEMREAVYDLTWSAIDPWIYVTLGFDGNVVLNHVPSKEKYKILL